MVRSSLVSRITLALLLGAGLMGCKSDVGERCQINEDCAEGLQCAASTDTCVEQTSDAGGTVIDAPIDAFDGDASDPDASLPIDAALPIDAPIDGV